MLNACSERLGTRLTSGHCNDPGTHVDGLVCSTVILSGRHGFDGDIDRRAHHSAGNRCFYGGDGGAVDVDRKNYIWIHAAARCIV